MSFVVANTEFVSGAAGNLARLGSMISAANSAAAAQTTAVAAAGADEVSSKTSTTTSCACPKTPSEAGFARTARRT
ncbi:PE PGRS family protein [Mycobacterium tuberculosis]|nr:PE PGRS family protein [Mycobacterium tuberculosis]